MLADGELAFILMLLAFVALIFIGIAAAMGYLPSI
jgi:hypothetical protein